MTQHSNAHRLSHLGELISRHDSVSAALASLSPEEREFWDTQVKGDEERSNLYAEVLGAVATRDDVVFYESMSGARVMDNPHAIFSHLGKIGSEKSSRLHVWSATSDGVIPAAMGDRDDVLFVRRHTPVYMYLLAAAKHIVGNSVLPGYFVRRAEQKYLNTWHGIGYKALGRSAKSLLGASLSVTNMLQATHVISPCSFMTETLVNGFSLEGTFTGELAETGYPRIDATINATEEVVARLKETLGTRPDLPTILYAPTWRGESPSAERQVSQLEQDLRALSQFNANVVFLGHHIMARRLRDANFPGVVIPPNNMNTNQLLAIADVLITDYSSIFFDFLVTGRPIVHYLFDYRSYSSARGLNLQLGELPGEVAFDTVGLQSQVRAALAGNMPLSQKYAAARRRFTPHENGESSARVCEWFFAGGKTSSLSLPGFGALDARKRVVFWGGHLVEGPALAGFLTELRNRSWYEDSNVTLVVSRRAVKSTGVKALLEELGSSISVVARENHEMGMTAEEYAARQVPGKERSNEQRALYDAIYKREYTRMFGDSSFDEVILYEGLSHFWKLLARFAVKQ